MSTSAWSMDEYDGEILKIKRVKVGNIEYSNVNITVDNVISIGNNFNLDDIDVYDPATNTLLIANVTYKDVIYRSVRVTIIGEADRPGAYQISSFLSLKQFLL